MRFMRALGYRRVSSRDQVQGTGLGRQATLIKKFALENAEGFRSRKGTQLHGPQIRNILRDYELGLINTTKSRPVEEYQDG